MFLPMTIDHSFFIVVADVVETKQKKAQIMALLLLAEAEIFVCPQFSMFVRDENVVVYVAERSSYLSGSEDHVT